MKVLFLNPHVQSDGHPIVQALQARGLAVLLPGNPREAWQMLSLHGASLDLAIIHREGAVGQNDDGGFEFINKAKADPQHADLPVVVTSHQWSDAECARHQDSPQGANAYLKWPFEAEALVELIKAVFGGAFPNASRPDLSRPTIPTASGSGAGSSFDGDISDTGIRLDVPPEDVPSPASAAAGSPSIALTALPERSDALAQVLAQDSSLSAPPEASGHASEHALGDAFVERSLDPPSGDGASVLSQAEADQDAAQEMPYLFAKEQRPAAAAAAVAFSLPLGDAVVPGGAAHAPDVETLKRYLLLREQDVAVLSSQLKAAKDQLKTLEDQLRQERGHASELSHVKDEQKRRIDEFEREKKQFVDALHAEIAELRFQLKAKADKGRMLEAKVREASDEVERIKERVRSDIRKIRVREKELENRLEIVKKDSEALISARENKIIELKRKLDLLEFNMDLLQDQHAREKENAAKLRERLSKAAQVVRVAGGLLDNPAGASQLAAALAGEDPGPGEASEDVA